MRAARGCAERRGLGAEKFLGPGQGLFRHYRDGGYGEAPAVELGRSRVSVALRDE
jgi:hypothetical protein